MGIIEILEIVLWIVCSLIILHMCKQEEKDNLSIVYGYIAYIIIMLFITAIIFAFLSNKSWVNFFMIFLFLNLLVLFTLTCTVPNDKKKKQR